MDTIKWQIHLIGIIGLAIVGLAGYAHFDYYNYYGFVCVTQGQIDIVFAQGMTILGFYAGYVIRWCDERRKKEDFKG